MENKLNDKQLLIMSKALEIFAEQGFDSTSVRDIAQQAEVNVAMISYYFGSKDKLLEAIFKNHTDKIKHKIASIMHSKTLAPLEKVDHIIDTYIKVIGENRLFHRLLMREQLLAKSGPLYDSIRDMKMRNRSLIEAAVKSGQKAGVFQKDIDVSMLSVTLFGSVNHYISNYRFIHSTASPKDDEENSFSTPVLEKLSNHLKVMFKAFLTYGIPGQQ